MGHFENIDDTIDSDIGASSGIGAATAEEFAKLGAFLSITGRNKDRLEKTAQKCREVGLPSDKVSPLN